MIAFLERRDEEYRSFVNQMDAPDDESIWRYQLGFNLILKKVLGMEEPGDEGSKEVD
jgi:hypothetical protein